MADLDYYQQVFEEAKSAFVRFMRDLLIIEKEREQIIHEAMEESAKKKISTVRDYIDKL
ncbi:MAG TPA: hypothetical protein VJA27_02105 [Patescibacteria group bacterium]|nr:hypothetical protein [Patescibacteria group bacterium]